MTTGLNFPGQVKSYKSKTLKWRKQHLQWAAEKAVYGYDVVRNSVKHKKINQDLILGKLHMEDLKLFINPDDVEEIGRDEHERNYYYPEGDGDGTFDGEAIAVIMEYLATVESVPLQLLKQEIEKLAIYAGERKRWTKEDVETTFSTLPEVSSFALNNAITNRNLLQVLELLADKRKKGENIMLTCGFVMSNIRNLLRIKEMAEAGYGETRIAAETDMNPYVVKKNYQACRRFSLASLQTALNDLAQMNIEIRQGGRQFERLEEILVKLLAA